MKDMDELHHFLGMKVLQGRTNETVWIGHASHSANTLHKYGMENCKAAATLMDPNVRLTKAK